MPAPVYSTTTMATIIYIKLLPIPQQLLHPGLFVLALLDDDHIRVDRAQPQQILLLPRHTRRHFQHLVDAGRQPGFRLLGGAVYLPCDATGQHELHTGAQQATEAFFEGRLKIPAGLRSTSILGRSRLSAQKGSLGGIG